MTWFKKKDRPQRPDENEERTVRTEGLFVKCQGCEEMLLKREIEVPSEERASASP